jgi:hypothetical protein
LEKEIVNTEKEIKDFKQMLFNEEVYSDLNKYNDLANLVKEKEKNLETLFAKYSEIDILD